MNDKNGTDKKLRKCCLESTDNSKNYVGGPVPTK